MRLPSLLALTAVLLVALPAAADAPLVVVVDAGPLRLDADALRDEVASATGREVITPADPRATGSDLLVVAHASGRRWVLRYQHGAASYWAEREIRPGALRTALAEASASLAQQAMAAPAAPAPEPVAEPTPPPEPTSAPCAVEAWPPETHADVVNPFLGWDPLRVAIALSLMEPFERSLPAASRWAWGTIVDPFAIHGDAWADLMDPWSPRP
jgi:hypothetical protein